MAFSEFSLPSLLIAPVPCTSLFLRVLRSQEKFLWGIEGLGKGSGNKFGLLLLHKQETENGSNPECPKL